MIGTRKYNSKNGMVTLEVDGLEGIDWGLSQLPLEMQNKVLDRAIRAACRVVVKRAKELCPAPGYPGDKPTAWADPTMTGRRTEWAMKPLRDTIGFVIRKYESTFVGVVGPERPAGSHGHLVELGTSAHEIIASGYASKAAIRKGKAREKIIARYASMQRKLALASKSQQIIFGRRVNHPGATAHPFMRPAAIDTKDQQQRAITDVLAEAITKVLVKHQAA